MHSSGFPVTAFQFQSANNSTVQSGFAPLQQTSLPCPLQIQKKALEVVVGYIFQGKFERIGNLRVELASGNAAIGQPSSATGPIRFDGLPEQDYELTLPAIDGKLWDVHSTEPLTSGNELSRGDVAWNQRQPPSSNGTNHTVAPGEGLDKIAIRYGHAPETIWGHFANATLAGSRHGWNVLAPNDSILIPPVTPKFLSVRPGHRFFLVHTRILARFRLRLCQGMLPIVNTPFLLEIPDCPPIVDTTTDAGLIDTAVPAFAQAAKITFGSPDSFAFAVKLESLLPVTSDDGVQQRLRNLGFPFESPVHPWAAGVIGRAQQSFGQVHTGLITEDLRKAIFQFHDR